MIPLFKRSALPLQDNRLLQVLSATPVKDLLFRETGLKIPYTTHMNRVMKIFLAAGLPFGTIMGALCSFRYGPQTGLICGLVSGLVSGLVLSLILGVLHIHAVKKVAPELNAEAYGISHVRNIRLHMPYDKAFDLCVRSLVRIKNCRSREQDRSQGRIIANTSVNWKTWGDTITFVLGKIDNENTEVKITSRPTARTTLVDYGKNLENIEMITGYLNKYQ